MFRHLSTVAWVILAALGSLALTIAMPSCGNQADSTKPDTATQEAGAGSKTEGPPKQIAVDLGRGVKLEMVRIPAGEFMMGSPSADKDARDEEKPQHRVRITKPYYLGTYLVTQEQWQAVMGNNPSHFTGPNSPVEEVSWDDCQQFLGKLNAKSRPGGGKFQLPSEAQWEYACRAGSKTAYSFGDDESGLGEYSWYMANANDKSQPVGQKKPNAFGLYDVHGNVGEWCQDWYGDGYYANSTADDPSGPTTGLTRVNRGGGWDRPARYCRSAFRSYYVPGFRLDFVGFRVAQVLADN
ncbi:MAG: formylglycine-generating enzyme family protein [Thermoguttaceae bacterium]|jgi:formylglycine-generating enzyme required for sulfatase activity